MGIACRTLQAQPPAPLGRGLRREREAKALVYVVDDVSDLTDLYRLLLEGAGYEVRTFNDRAEALRHFTLARWRPSLLITDYLGYPISAEDLMDACRRTQPGLKILMVSGCLAGSLSFPHVAPDRYLEKPFALEHFLAEVKSLTAVAGRS